MHNVGTVSTYKMHNVGTVPTFKMHNVGTLVFCQTPLHLANQTHLELVGEGADFFLTLKKEGRKKKEEGTHT